MKRLSNAGAVLVWLVMGCNAAPLDAVGLPPGNPARALLAHWTFDEGSGAAAADHSGNGHDAQLTAGAWISDGRFAGGWRLGPGDSAAVPNFPAATPSWSVSAWIRLSDEQLAANGGPWATIVSTENLYSGGWELNIDNNQPPNPRFVFSYSSSPVAMDYLVTDCVCVETHAWIHLAAVVDAEANRVTLYRNGTVSDREIKPSNILPGDSTLYFGRWNMQGRFLAGDLDDIAVWTRALTATEIAALATASP